MGVWRETRGAKKSTLPKDPTYYFTVSSATIETHAGYVLGNTLRAYELTVSMTLPKREAFIGQRAKFAFSSSRRASWPQSLRAGAAWAGIGSPDVSGDRTASSVSS